jgi:hypothetical protein
VDVGRQAAAEGHAVGVGLLLREGPGLLAAALRVLQVVVDLRPLRAGLDLEQAELGVEIEHAVELARVDHHALGGEGLAAHRMAAAGDADRALLGARQLVGAAHGVERAGLDDLEHARAGELAVHVVDQDALDLLGFRLPPGGPLRPQRGEAGDADEIAAIEHVASCC